MTRREKRRKATRRARRVKRLKAFFRGVLSNLEFALLVIAVLAAAKLVFSGADWSLSEQLPGKSEIPAGISNDYGEKEEIVYDTSMEKVILEKYYEHAAVAAGMDNSGWIIDGRAVVIGRSQSGQCDTQDWYGIRALALGDGHTMGLTSEGGIVFAGDNTYGQCDLNTDGARVVSIAVSSRASFAVLENGRVKMSGSGAIDRVQAEKERNIAVVAASDSHVVFLKKDGTLTAYGENNAGECDVSRWKKIEMVSCGYNVTMALDSEGVVHIAGDTVYNQKALDNTTQAEAVSAGGNFCMVLLESGEMLSAGSNSRGQSSVEDWQNIRTMSCGYMHAIAVTQDGVRIYSGANQYGQQE